MLRRKNFHLSNITWYNGNGEQYLPWQLDSRNTEAHRLSVSMMMTTLQLKLRTSSIQRIIIVDGILRALLRFGSLRLHKKFCNFHWEGCYIDVDLFWFLDFKLQSNVQLQASAQKIGDSEEVKKTAKEKDNGAVLDRLSARSDVVKRLENFIRSIWISMM